MNVYEVKIANYENVSNEQPDPIVWSVNVVSDTFLDAVRHIEEWLAAKHPKDEVVGGGIIFENVHVTLDAMHSISDIYAKVLAKKEEVKLRDEMRGLGLELPPEPTPEDVKQAVKDKFPIPSDFPKTLAQTVHDAGGLNKIRDPRGDYPPPLNGGHD